MTRDVTAQMALLESRVDKLTQALFHVAEELWAARDRQAVLERLLADRGISAPELIDNFRPDAALAETLKARRDAFLSGLLAYLAPEG